MRTIHNNPPTKEEFEIYEKVRLFYELEVVMDEYEDALEYNSAPSALLSDILSNVFDSVLD